MSGTGRRNLVIARVGDNSLHKHWLEGAPRNWDLQLNAFGKDEARVQDGDLPLVIDRGTRNDSLARQFRAHPELFDRYDYILTPDDDMLVSANEFNRLFDICAARDLTVAQMSLTHDSYFSHAIVLNVPGFELRYTNFVEGMTSCFKASYLKRLVPLFEYFSTGWGADLVWCMLMPDPAFRSAIVDAVQAKHTRPMGTGPLYKQLQSEARSPAQDVEQLLSTFENFPPGMIVYGGVRSLGERVSAPDAMRANAASLLKIAGASHDASSARRIATGMLLRSFTQAHYKPQTLIPKANAPEWMKALCDAR